MRHLVGGRQHGVEVPRNTLAGWVEQETELLRPIYRAMQAKLRKRTYLQVDETPTRYLDPEVKGKSELGYMWVYLDPGGEVLFQWSTGRAHDVADCTRANRRRGPAAAHARAGSVAAAVLRARHTIVDEGDLAGQ